MQLFTEPLLFDEKVSDATGGTDGQFKTVALLIYKVGWKDLNLGYAAAMAWALFLMIVVFASINAFITASSRGPPMTDRRGRRDQPRQARAGGPAARARHRRTHRPDR